MSSADIKKVMSKARIESFSDNVFSIVLTLMVFNFKLPNLKGPDFNQELYDKLFGMDHYFVSYILSFVLISIFWVAHHSLFHSLKHSTTQLLWINNLFLLCLAFLPFPTQILGTYPDTESAAVFFGMTMVSALLSFSFLRYYCYFYAKLSDDTVNKKYMNQSLIRGMVGAVLYSAAIAISVYSPDITLGLYALIPFLYFIHQSNK